MQQDGNHMAEQELELQELNGTVTTVLYSNAENGYTVLKLQDSDDRQQTVVGCFPFLAPGEKVLASGAWVTHPTYGMQFKAEFVNRIPPSTSDDIFRYLSHGVIKGIGPVLASAIVEAFHEKTLDVLEAHPEKLAQIQGISLKRAQDFCEQYRQLSALRRIVDYVCSFGVRPVIGIRLYRFYGSEAMSMLRTDPYIIAASHIGGMFPEADRMALELGFATDSVERIRAAIHFELVHNLSNGHCFIPEGDLIAAVCQMISVDEDPAMRALDDLAENKRIIRETMRGIRACYLPELYEAETYLAERLKTMNRMPVDPVRNQALLIKNLEESSGISYTPEQRKAFELALGRMSQLSGREAATVHRLLGARMEDGSDLVHFAKNEDDPLNCDAVILDECSMVDLLLLAALVRAVPQDARLILVGDCDQLPPVGPGKVFRGMIESGIFPTVKFTEIFRQSEGSLIVKNAHLINDGKIPDFSDNKADFFRLKRLEEASAVETITELCAVRLPNRMHIAPEEIQVLSPTRRGELGTVWLNRQLQQVLNPPDKEKAEQQYGDVVFREGDRIMQIRNNYDLLWTNEDQTLSGIGIYNGDIGYIRRIDKENESLILDFDGKITLYSFANLNELEHAWAVTIHKAQGSEFKAVILALSPSSKMLLTRSVLYTGVTRARDLLILVGDDAIARRMIGTVSPDSRFTFFKTRLRMK